jgi:hypothetical protein
MKLILVNIKTKIEAALPFFFEKGQIDLKSEVGRWIYFLSSLSSTSVIVEIGTWNGKGSSNLIACGVIKSQNLNKTVIGLEINKNLVTKARKNLKKYQFFKVLHGSIINVSEVDEVDRVDLTGPEINWLRDDLIDIEKAPNVLDQIPSEINLLLLDGGEFTTYAEYKNLKNRIKGYVILDDTESRKCRRVLLEAKKEKLVIFESHERNGTAVLYIPR